jgi:hypothetical protein
MNSISALESTLQCCTGFRMLLYGELFPMPNHYELYLFNIKVAMCRYILLQVPRYRISEKSAILELFQAYRQTNAKNLIDASQNYNRA